MVSKCLVPLLLRNQNWQRTACIFRSSFSVKSRTQCLYGTCAELLEMYTKTLSIQHDDDLKLSCISHKINNKLKKKKQCGYKLGKSMIQAHKKNK